MSVIHPYYITSQLFQLVEEQVASIEVDRKLRPLASVFVRLFDDLDYNFSNELVAEALERLIIFIQKEDTISTVEFSQVEAFFTDENNHLFVRVDDVPYLVVEPSEVEEEDDFEEGQEFEEDNSISLEDDEAYIVIDGDEVIDEYELNEEITLDDENSYLVIEDEDFLDDDDDIHDLSFDAEPIVLDHGYAELITLATTTDIDELLDEQIDDLPALKEVIEELLAIRKEVKKEAKSDKKIKKKSKKKKLKSKKDKKSKKDLNIKIEKRLFKYIKEKELGEELLAEFITLKKQIDYILIQY